MKSQAMAIMLVAMAAGACSKSEPGSDAKPAAISAEAREVYKTTCVPCHGESGKGDGPGAVALDPKPRNYTDAKWQDSITDEQLRKTIIYGGAAVGKSAIMPSQPQLEGKPEVLNGLVAIIRSFKGK